MAASKFRKPKPAPQLTLSAPHTRSASLALLASLLVAYFLATFLAFRLPTPVGKEHAAVTFSEEKAMEHVRALAEDIGLRSVGTVGEKRAEEYLVDQLRDLKAKSNVPFTIEVQRSDGSHEFDMMGTVAIKNYVNITNVIAHISCGVECDANAVLVNAHYDSQFGTPGACDDATPVAVMLEMARVLSLKDASTFRNSLVLLFNGGEESLQDASHAFSMFHPLAKTVRTFINLEAMGNSGKEVLFQANSQGLVEAYARSVRRPHGTASSNDLFSSGLIMSDTDYRQFVDYGSMLGIDMAIYQNSYLYHTMLDTAENVETGLIQHLGDNTLDLVSYLMSTAEIEKFTESRDFIYFDLFDTFFFVYDAATANMIHAALIFAVAFELVRPALRFKSFSSGKKDMQPSPVRSLFAFAKTFSFLLANFFAALLSPVLLGVITQYVLDKPLMYFKNEAYAVVMFVPASVMGIFATHIATRLFVHSDILDTPVAFERRVFAGNMVLSSTLILVMTAAGLGST
ncbi:hypothetical protein HDU98_003262, partial [Podochytrium sp. JEL0797]